MSNTLDIINSWWGYPKIVYTHHGYMSNKYYDRKYIQYFSFANKYWFRGDIEKEYLKIINTSIFRKCYFYCPDAFKMLIYGSTYIPYKYKEYFGPLIINAKNCIKIFRNDYSILNLYAGVDEMYYVNEIEARLLFNKFVNIPNIHNKGKRNDIFYFTEEYIPGELLISNPNFLKYWGKIIKTLIYSMILGYKNNHLFKMSFNEYVGKINSNLIFLDDNIIGKLKSIIGKLHNYQIIIVIAHGDFNPSNIIEYGGKYYFIDWDRSNKYSILHDVLNFIIWLDVFKNEGKTINHYLHSIRSGLLQGILEGMLDRKLFKNELLLYVISYILEKTSIQYGIKNKNIGQHNKRFKKWYPVYKKIILDINNSVEL